MDIDAIAEILEAAGRDIIMPAFTKMEPVHTKADGSVFTEVDLSCQSHIRDQLAARYPDIPFLGEEMETDELQRILAHRHQRYWCLDPLDGSSNFVTGLPLFATALALIEDGRPHVACIHDPVRSETFTAIRGRGARLNGLAIRASAVTDVQASIGFIDFKRLNEPLASTLATRRFYRSQRNIGSCALEWAWLAAGRAQFIVHGGQKLWDYAAGSLLAEEAGCSVSDFDGNHPFAGHRLSSPIAAAPPPVHKQLLEFLP